MSHPINIGNNGPLSPIHWSPSAGVHADIGFGRDKIHVPFQGQTTLQTFYDPGYGNDQKMFNMGGTLINKDIFNP